jgi:hypothetical protein
MAQGRKIFVTWARKLREEKMKRFENEAIVDMAEV